MARHLRADFGLRTFYLSGSAGVTFTEIAPQERALQVPRQRIRDCAPARRNTRSGPHVRVHRHLDCRPAEACGPAPRKRARSICMSHPRLSLLRHQGRSPSDNSREWCTLDRHRIAENRRCPHRHARIRGTHPARADTRDPVASTSLLSATAETVCASTGVPASTWQVMQASIDY